MTIIIILPKASRYIVYWSWFPIIKLHVLYMHMYSSYVALFCIRSHAMHTSTSYFSYPIIPLVHYMCVHVCTYMYMYMQICFFFIFPSVNAFMSSMAIMHVASRILSSLYRPNTNPRQCHCYNERCPGVEVGDYLDWCSSQKTL